MLCQLKEVPVVRRVKKTQGGDYLNKVLDGLAGENG